MDILNRELSGFSTRYHINGCDIVINSGVAQHLSLLVHELATNAVKYGALSAPDGFIAIDGSIEQLNGEGWFLFTWKESGGPAVARPLRKGFGTTLLLGDAQQCGRDVSLRFDPGGLNYELRLRLGGMSDR